MKDFFLHIFRDFSCSVRRPYPSACWPCGFCSLLPVKVHRIEPPKAAECESGKMSANFSLPLDCILIESRFSAAVLTILLPLFCSGLWGIFSADIFWGEGGLVEFMVYSMKGKHIKRNCVASFGWYYKWMKTALKRTNIVLFLRQCCIKSNLCIVEHFQR